MATQELEYKFLLDEGLADQLAEHPQLVRFSESPPATQELLSIYFDTPEFDLFQRGLGFRLRKKGETWLQTVKTDGESGDCGFFEREEWERPIAGDTPDFEALSGHFFYDIFSDPQLREGLRPIFTTQFQRTTWHLRPESTVLLELVLDRGSVRTDEAATPILELELELISGSPRDLNGFADRLNRLFDLKPGLESKAARGYRLIGLSK